MYNFLVYLSFHTHHLSFIAYHSHPMLGTRCHSHYETRQSSIFYLLALGFGFLLFTKLQCWLEEDATSLLYSLESSLISTLSFRAFLWSSSRPSPASLPDEAGAGGAGFPPMLFAVQRGPLSPWLSSFCSAAKKQDQDQAL